MRESYQMIDGCDCNHPAFVEAINSLNATVWYVPGTMVEPPVIAPAGRWIDSDEAKEYGAYEPHAINVARNMIFYSPEGWSPHLRYGSDGYWMIPGACN